MGGMGAGSGFDDPTVVTAFHRALLEGGAVVAALLAALFVVWSVVHRRQLRQAAGAAGSAGDRARPAGEPAGRRLIRIGFGLLWVLDGTLQGQAAMPLGMVPGIIEPAADPSPAWVRHAVHPAASVWSHHPVAAAASVVWIQVGVGLLMLVAARGTWSRLSGLAGAAWGLTVWVFGEAFGGIFAPGLTWLFGAPGAALLYAVAGALVALPEGAWAGGRVGRWALRGSGAFFVGMALLQAWPGRGFWQGGPTGSLVGMVSQMASGPQPGALGNAVSGFASFTYDHGWAVNLFAVVALAAVGAGLLCGRRRTTRPAVAAAVVLCLADWVLVEDLGFLGGMGTDPNSMIPIVVLLIGALLASSPLPGALPAEHSAGEPLPWRRRLAAEPAYALRVAAALAAAGVILVGAAPMAVALGQTISG